MKTYNCVIDGYRKDKGKERHSLTVQAETMHHTKENLSSCAYWEAIKKGHELGLKHILVVKCDEA